MPKLSSVPVRSIFSFLLALALILTSSAGPAVAEPFQRVDQFRFFDLEQNDRLVEPAWVEASESGDLVLWDRGSRQFIRWHQFFNDPSPASLSSPLPDFKQQIRHYLQTSRTRTLLKEDRLRGYWDDDRGFWSYRVERQDTRVRIRFFKPFAEEEKDFVLSEMPRAIVPHQSHWYIQTDTGPLIKWDPQSSRDHFDTARVSLNGTLIAIGNSDQYLTRSRNEIRLYEEGVAMHSRVFRDLRSVRKTSDGIFVLESNRRILRLDDNLSIQFTYRLPSGRNIRDFVLQGNQIVLVGSSGLFYSKLDESKRSFFSSTQNLKLTKILGTLPRFLEERSQARIWARSGPEQNPETIYIRENMDRARELTPDPNGEQLQSSRMSLDDLPLNPFQYFQTEDTFWDGENRLYYFFEESQSVEAFNFDGQIVRKTALGFDSLPPTRDVSFLGADSERILFEGETIGPARGFQRSLFIFDWKGQLQRIVTPDSDHPKQFEEGIDPRPEWRYGGDGYLYVLRQDSVQRYDLWGYPEQTIQQVVAPADLLRVGNQIYLLDLEGRRLSIFKVPDDTSHVRYASPPQQVNIHSVARIPDRQELVFAGEPAGSSESDNKRIYAYNRETMEYETVFEHPRLSLRHPLVSPEGESLFFWGHSGEGRSRLYISDLQQYAARPTSVYMRPRGSGQYDPERELLLIPVENKDEQYAYVEQGDTVASLQNSEHLQGLTPGGFTGYFGIEEEDGRSYIVSGFLSRDADTAPWKWNRSDTVAVWDEPIKEVVYREGTLHLVTEPRPGFSRVGQLPLDDRNRSQDTGPASFQWDWLARGNWQMVSPGGDRSLFLVQESVDGGYLAHLHSASPPTGGVQGKLISSSPATLSGLTIRTVPGGQRMKTDDGGNFSGDGLPTGYLRLFLEGHEHHFTFPVRALIRAGEFQLLSDLSVEVERELLLLERGIRYFNKRDFSRARITIEAYRNLVEEGAFYQYAGAFLKEVYTREGRIEDLYQLYQEDSRLFDAHDRIQLFRQLSNPSAKRQLIRDLNRSWEPRMNSIRNQILRDPVDSNYPGYNLITVDGGQVTSAPDQNNGSGTESNGND